jgi:pimeloyl-ACP methyl ester carboxylesterase
MHSLNAQQGTSNEHSSAHDDSGTLRYCSAITSGAALRTARASGFLPHFDERERIMTAEQKPSNRPTIVLVHGAFAESASWNDVISTLCAHGFPVIAAANPLRGVRHDSAYVASILASINGPIVLVGHSYGGTVISNAAAGNPQVAALVYVAGFAPEAGESAADLAGRFPGGTLGETLAPVPLPEGGADLYIRQELFRNQFCADVPESEARRMAAGQRPCTELALNEASGAPAWKNIPSWFIFGELDKNIPAAAHRFMAERAGARATIELKGASHAIGVSYADSVAEMILRAAGHHAT